MLSMNSLLKLSVFKVFYFDINISFLAIKISFYKIEVSKLKNVNQLWLFSESDKP